MRELQLRSDVLQMRAANCLLAEPATLFETNPLLGCYFLVCADTSTIVNFMFDDLGRPGFQYGVEKACREQLDPTLRLAMHLIDNHRMLLSGTDLAKFSVKGAEGGNEIAVRSPGTVRSVKAETVNRRRGCEAGFCKQAAARTGTCRGRGDTRHSGRARRVEPFPVVASRRRRPFRCR